jgi:hypothetical protein
LVMLSSDTAPSLHDHSVKENSAIRIGKVLIFISLKYGV